MEINEISLDRDLGVSRQDREAQLLALLETRELTTEDARAALKMLNSSSVAGILQDMRREGLVDRSFTRVRSLTSCGMKMIRTSVWRLKRDGAQRPIVPLRWEFRATQARIQKVFEVIVPLTAGEFHVLPEGSKLYRKSGQVWGVSGYSKSAFLKDQAYALSQLQLHGKQFPQSVDAS